LSKQTVNYRDEKELIQGLIDKNPTAFEHLYSSNKAPIESLIFRSNGNEEDAKDVIQEAVVILYKKISEEGFELNSSISTFLYAIAKRVWFRNLKSKSKSRVTSILKKQLSIEDDNVFNEIEISRMHLYRKHFKRLGSDCQQVLRLFLTKHTMEEIAEIMKYASAGYAKKRKYKCKNKLLELIKADPLFKVLKS